MSEGLNSLICALRVIEPKYFEELDKRYLNNERYLNNIRCKLIQHLMNVFYYYKILIDDVKCKHPNYCFTDDETEKHFQNELLVYINGIISNNIEVSNNTHIIIPYLKNNKEIILSIEVQENIIIYEYKTIEINDRNKLIIVTLNMNYDLINDTYVIHIYQSIMNTDIP